MKKSSLDRRPRRTLGRIEYRVVRVPFRDGSGEGYGLFRIFWDDAGKYWWHEERAPFGRSPEDLWADILEMLEALDRPAVVAVTKKPWWRQVQGWFR